MTHSHIKTKYIRDLLANEIYSYLKSMKGSRLTKVYGNPEFCSYLFGLDTAFHRIDQRVQSGKMAVWVNMTLREYLEQRTRELSADYSDAIRKNNIPGAARALEMCGEINCIPMVLYAANTSSRTEDDKHHV